MRKLPGMLPSPSISLERHGKQLFAVWQQLRHEATLYRTMGFGD
jgi:hypothetical protein